MHQLETSESKAADRYERFRDITGIGNARLGNLLLDPKRPLIEQEMETGRAFDIIWKVAQTFYPADLSEHTVSLSMPVDRLLELELIPESIVSRVLNRLLRLGSDQSRGSRDTNHMLIEPYNYNTINFTKTHFVDQLSRPLGRRQHVEEVAFEELLSLRRDESGQYFPQFWERELTMDEYQAERQRFSGERTNIDIPDYQEVPTANARTLNRFLIMIIEGTFGKMEQ